MSKLKSLSFYLTKNIRYLVSFLSISYINNDICMYFLDLLLVTLCRGNNNRSNRGKLILHRFRDIECNIFFFVKLLFYYHFHSLNVISRLTKVGNFTNHRQSANLISRIRGAHGRKRTFIRIYGRRKAYSNTHSKNIIVEPINPILFLV